MQTLKTITGGLLASLMLTTVAGAQKPPTPKLDDAEIAHVAVTANAIDIEVGQYAAKHAESAAVRAFAETMIRDHTGVNAQAGALASKLGVTPRPNGVSASLRKGQTTSMEKLRRVSGKAFDRAYMDNEIVYHQAVIDAVDAVLVPQTQNGELKALLVSVRPALAAHLAHAKTVRSGLK